MRIASIQYAWPKGRRTAALLSAGLFLSLIFGHVAPAAAMSSSTLVSLTNQQRQNAGLASLTINPKLVASATAKANDMIAQNYWAHTSPSGAQPWSFMDQAGYAYTAAGENLARGFSSDAATMTGWMNSPGHRANILNANYQEIGIAVVHGIMDGQETDLVVAHYGRPVAQRAVAAPAAKPAPQPAAQAAPQAVKTQTVTTEASPNSSEPQTAVQPAVKGSSSKLPLTWQAKILDFFKTFQQAYSAGLRFATTIVN